MMLRMMMWRRRRRRKNDDVEDDDVEEEDRFPDSHTFVRACPVEMHIDVAQEPFCAIS